jgi:N-acetylglucosamine kinase-like BadF-type ATPase
VPELVVGVDAGGTSTRCLVVTGTGAVVGRASTGGANIRSTSAKVQDRFTEVLAAALDGVAPRDVAGGVFGVAGAGAAGARVVRAAVEASWANVGLPGLPRVVTDLEVAFAAGTVCPDGLLLLAGTGAAAASFAGRRIARRCDGYGWLLGDEGSAVWLGLRGVRAALDAHDGRGPATRLQGDLAAHFEVSAPRYLPQVLIARLHADDPARLGALAPLVTAAARAGDAVAAALVDAAADRLVAAIRAVGGGTVHGALVLAGALLADGPVRAAVLARLAGEQVGVFDAGPGAAGAVALALAALRGGELAPDLHEAVLRAAAQ